jgi:hypothetical protein
VFRIRVLYLLRVWGLGLWEGLGLGLSETCGDPKTCVQVAKAGNLAVLMKWLREHDPP